ncbi:uncharacterized protein LOC128662245 [Bombina bombina]|uniref:uncharacterized protein LOC128662245 n=1 Tax=Bombina bombina TaxID=8345 RepID=UPI00235ACE5E|nr:uncharacterized protein LOC128662245 [Bombina bombina]
MDPSSDVCGSIDPSFDHEEDDSECHRTFSLLRSRFEKSESEDSGVELPPTSPFGSENSYNPEETESLENSSPEEPESLKCFPSYKLDDLKVSSCEGRDVLEDCALSKSQTLNSSNSNDLTNTAVSSAQEQTRVRIDLPLKLEQAVLRSRRQRISTRDSHHNRTGTATRNYTGSLKDQRRIKQLSVRSRSPNRAHQEKEEKDLLALPGDGIRYLESLCVMLEQIAELQQRNQCLQQEMREAEERQNRVHFIDACVCGSSGRHGNIDLNMADGPLPEMKPWKSTHYRKRSSSHTGVLQSITQTIDNNLTGAEKLEPHFVSVPNLQDEEISKTEQNCKYPQTDASQWNKIKYLMSKFTRKAAGAAAAQENSFAGTQNNYRSQALQQNSSPTPKRLFLPSLVIRPRSQRRQFV